MLYGSKLYIYKLKAEKFTQNAASLGRKDIKKSEQLRYMDERMRDSNMCLNGCFRRINGKNSKVVFEEIFQN